MISPPSPYFTSSHTALFCITKHSGICINSSYSSAAWDAHCKVIWWINKEMMRLEMNLKGTLAVSVVSVFSSFTEVDSWELKKHPSLCYIASSDWCTLQTITQKFRVYCLSTFIINNVYDCITVREQVYISYMYVILHLLTSLLLQATVTQIISTVQFSFQADISLPKRLIWNVSLVNEAISQLLLNIHSLPIIMLQKGSWPHCYELRSCDPAASSLSSKICYKAGKQTKS